MPVLFLSLLHTSSLNAFSLLYFYLNFVFDWLPEISTPGNQGDDFFSPALLAPSIPCLYDHKPSQTFGQMFFSQSCSDPQFQVITGYRVLGSLGWNGLWSSQSHSPTLAGRPLATLPASGHPAPDCQLW